VGLSAAAATAVVGLVNGRQQRRHHRDNLVLDVELAMQLKDGPTKSILEDFIAWEIQHIAVRGYTEVQRRARNFMSVVVLAASITMLGIDAASNSHEIRQFLIIAAFVSGLLFLILAAVLLWKENLEYEKRRLTAPTETSIRTKFRNALKLKRIQAAWKALTGADEPGGPTSPQ
jgi:hypothetical protein